MSYADRYTEIEEIDAAPSGRLYRAEHGVLRRQVLIRVISGDYATEHGDAIRDAIKGAAGLVHHAILAPTDADLAGDEIYYVTDRPTGGLLAGRIAADDISATEAARWGADILDALLHAHEHGLTHGTLSPWTVHLRQDGGAALADFGLPGSRRSADGREITVDARLAPYLPGSTWVGDDVAHESTDYAAAAIVIVRLLTGAAPAPGVAVDHEAFDGAPASLERSLRRMLRSEASADDVAAARDALQRWSRGERTSSASTSAGGFSRTRNVTAVDHNAGSADDDDEASEPAPAAETAAPEPATDAPVEAAEEAAPASAAADEMFGDDDDMFASSEDVASDTGDDTPADDEDASLDAFADSGDSDELDAAFADVGVAEGHESSASDDDHEYSVSLDDTAGHPFARAGIEDDADDIEIVEVDSSPSTSGVGGRTMAMDGLDVPSSRASVETQANPAVDGDEDDISQRVKDKLDKYSHLFEDPS